MAEPDKGAASSSKAQEKKNSVLDDDISKNFLGSWNSILGAESDDSSMDFKFEPDKGKKEKFNFDKMDMDFSLDGEFGNMNSFKVDMGDLDFPSPAKTSTKSKTTNLDFSSPAKSSTKSKATNLDFSPPKESAEFNERLEGDSVKSNKGKQDRFAFSFDFNELDKFDLDAVLPTRTKELNKDDGNKGAKIKSMDKQEDQGSKVQLIGTDATQADVLKEKSNLVNRSNSKENLAARVDDLDMLPQSDPSETSSGGISTDRLSQLENKPRNESCDKSELQNQATQYVQDQGLPQPAVVSPEREITEHAQKIVKQTDQVTSSYENSYEKPEVHNQSACSFPDKISAPDVPEMMLTTSANDKSGDADSKTLTLNAKIDSGLTSENENYSVEKIMPHYDSKHVRSLEVVLEGTDREENSSERSSASNGDMGTATEGETSLHVQGSDAVDLPKLGPHVVETNSGRQKTPMETSSSLLSRFNLKPLTKDESHASAQVSPRSNLVSLNRKAISSLHPIASGARHNTHSAQSRSNMDKNSALHNQEAAEGCFVSDNNMKVASNRSTRGNCNTMEAHMKINMDVMSLPHGGKAEESGATSLGIENEEEDTKSSSIQVQSSVLPDSTSKTSNQASVNLKPSMNLKPSVNLKPKTPSFQPVRKLKMDTIVGKLSTLKVSKKMPNLEGLKLSSSPALKDKAVTANNLDMNEMTRTAKEVLPVGSLKPRFPALSIKRKISEVSDAAPIISHPPKRLSASQSRTAKDNSKGIAQEEVTHKNIMDCSLKSDSNKQSESQLNISHEMKFSDVGVIPLMEKDETIEKAEALGKELDQICSILRKKQEEAKELLVRALVSNNSLLLLRNSMNDLKLSQVQSGAARLISKELPSRRVNSPALH